MGMGRGTRPRLSGDGSGGGCEACGDRGRIALRQGGAGDDGVRSAVCDGAGGSSGKGGATLLRRNYGEAVESLTGGEYYWMAGNFMKYGASEATFGSMNPGDIPVDSNELIALCAPRLTFISYGVPEKGDAHWLDHQGSFMATVDASRCSRCLGAKGLGGGFGLHTAKMPPVNQGCWMESWRGGSMTAGIRMRRT
jgi:hypothetical protein